MDIKQALRELPAPDATAPDRIWSRFETTRGRTQARQRQWRFALPVGVGVAMAAAAALVLMLRPPHDVHRTLTLEASAHTPGSVRWSPEVHLTFMGTGSVSGTSRDLVVHWESGELAAEVEPDTATALSIVTDEAEVEVVGTRLHVQRDALGVTTWVDRGEVRVQCADGWTGNLGARDEPHTCLPVRPAMLLGRADALRQRGAAAAEVLDALDRGLGQATAGDAVHAELLALRMEVLAELERVDDSLADARAYLSVGGPREVDVLRFAAWLSLRSDGCDAAAWFFKRLEPDATAEDLVLWAECLASSDPAHAQALVARALDEASLDDAWSARAHAVLTLLHGEVP